jgi:hypothetical protein
MRTFTWRINSGSAKSTFDNIAHCYVLEAYRWCFGPEKYSPAAG